MQIIIKEKIEGENKKPKFVATPKPENMTFKEKEKYWRDEEEKWNVGSNGFSGDYYFYLTQCYIKTPSGKRILPRWRDGDEELFKWSNDVENRQIDGLVFKRRRAGYSTVVGARTMHKLLTNQGSGVGLTSCNKDRTKDLFNNKIMVAFNSLDRDINLTHLKAADYKDIKKAELTPTWIHFRAGTGTRQEGTLNIEFLKDLIPTGDISNLYCPQTSDAPKDASKFEGGAYKMIVIDEIFLHPYAEEVRLSVSSALTEGGGYRIGSSFLGGSAGLMAREGAKLVLNLLEDIESGATKTMSKFFIRGTSCIEMAEEFDDNGNKTGKFHNFCLNGYSDHKSAEEWILKTREQLKKKKDQKEYVSFVLSYPLTIEEIFEWGHESWLSEDIMKLISEQRLRILNQPKEDAFTLSRYLLENDVTTGRIKAKRV